MQFSVGKFISFCRLFVSATPHEQNLKTPCRMKFCVVAAMQFFILLLLIFVGLVTGAVLGYVFRAKIDTNLRQSIEDSIDGYKSNSTDELTLEVDFMQSEVSRRTGSRYRCKSNSTDELTIEVDFMQSEVSRRTGSRYPKMLSMSRYKYLVGLTI